MGRVELKSKQVYNAENKGYSKRIYKAICSKPFQIKDIACSVANVNTVPTRRRFIVPKSLSSP